MHAFALICSRRYNSARCCVRCCFFPISSIFENNIRFPNRIQSRIFPPNRMDFKSIHKKKSRFESIRFKIRSSLIRALSDHYIGVLVSSSLKIINVLRKPGMSIFHPLFISCFFLFPLCRLDKIIIPLCVKQNIATMVPILVYM